MIRTIQVVIDEIDWPQMRCAVITNKATVERVSLYDTAGTNFEVLVSNALHATVREMLRVRKEHPGGEPVVPPAPETKPRKKSHVHSKRRS